MITLILVLAVMCVVVGLVVLSANPHRFTNQVFTLGSLMMTCWLLLVLKAVVVESGATVTSANSLIPWYRANAAVAGFWPWLIWLIRESLENSEEHRVRIIKRSWRWFSFCFFLAMLCYTDTFVFKDNTGVYHRGVS